jgi:hemerythrin
MALLTWNESYSVKVKQCDDDHKKLFSSLNALHEAMMAGKGADAVRQTLKELADYTRYHFASEESLMQKTSYPYFGSSSFSAPVVRGKDGNISARTGRGK